ncbi:MAG: S8 family serine peptidase [Tepidisphaeraceae bacterium]|jgi:hypothetical protein
MSILQTLRSSARSLSSCLLPVAAALFAAQTAHGQDAVTAVSGWAINVNGFLPQGTGAQSRNVVFSGSPGTQTAGWVQITGSANQDGDATPDTFRPSIQGLQTFTTDVQTNVFMPFYLNGQITFNPLNAATNFATVSYYNNSSVQLINTVGNVVVASAPLSIVGGTASPQATGNYTVALSTLLSAPNVAAGTYRVVLSLGISGNADGTAPNISANGSTENVNYGTGANGLVGSFAAIPTAGIGDSRAAVTAPDGRATYGVDGTGVQVAVLEPGSVDSTNPDLQSGAGSRVSYLYPAGGLGVGVTAASLQSEHALAVAGVIAGSGGNNSQNGIAPNATILSVPMSQYAGNGSAQFQAGVNRLLDVYPNINIVNMSATSGAANVAGDNTFINGVLASNANLTFVEAAGNTANTAVMAPAGAANTISVGALNNNFTALAQFSSFGTGSSLQAPDIVAPGQYITSAVENAVNGGYYANFFEGSDYNNFNNGSSGATTGDITGTSFASPMVAGATALLNQYGNATFNADTAKVNALVMKAVLLNSASIYAPGTTNLLLENDNATGWNQGVSGNATPLNPTIVTRSLDPQLGAGMLNVKQSLKQYATGDVQVTNNNTQEQEVINGQNKIDTVGGFWDLEQVTELGGVVDYTLGDISSSHLRATLTWDNVDGEMPDLQLELYHENFDDGGNPNPALDTLLAETTDTGDNVKLLDLNLPEYPVGNGNGDYYLQVTNQDDLGNWTYGLAVYVPEPGSATLLLMCSGLLLRRRRMSRAA